MRYTAVVLRWQEAKLLVAKAYRHTEQVLQENLDKLQAVRLGRRGCPHSLLLAEPSRHREPQRTYPCAPPGPSRTPISRTASLARTVST